MTRQKIKAMHRVVKRGEQVRWVSVVDRGWRIPKEITVTLLGQGGRFEWFIFVIGRDNAAFPLNIQVVHKAPLTTSNISARSVLDGESQIAWNAKAIVEHGAVGSDTYLSFRTLLLSPKARAKTIPSLEIATDDVTAGHAASVDRLDDDALHYCATRGLDQSEAKKLLVRAFLSSDAPQAAVKLLENI